MASAMLFIIVMMITITFHHIECKYGGNHIYYYHDSENLHAKEQKYLQKYVNF